MSSYGKPCEGCNEYPCKHYSPFFKEKCSKAKQKGPKFDQELEQHSIQEGSKQGTDQEQLAVQVPISEGPELDSSQDQSGNIMGPEQSNEQEQFTGQIPIQDGSEIDNDQEQIVAQVPIQEGSTLDNSQNTSQMPSQEGPDLSQTQMQEQNQEDDQFQIMGDQSQDQGRQEIEGHTNMSPLDNNQMIDTSVSGVTVNNTTNVKCGCSIDKDKHHDRHKGRCNEDCCVKDMASLLNKVRIAQSGIEDPTDQGVEIYHDGNLPLPNPIPGQVITVVSDCDTVTFRPADPPTSPTTTLRIENITGIGATDDPDTEEDIFDFLLTLGTTCSLDDADCKKKLCCEGDILNNLRAAQTFGLEIDLFVSGLDTEIPGVFVYNICDCIGYFVNDLVEPGTIYAFSICDISGYTLSTPE